jgi:hypothetical protein
VELEAFGLLGHWCLLALTGLVLDAGRGRMRSASTDASTLSEESIEGLLLFE